MLRRWFGCGRKKSRYDGITMEALPFIDRKVIEEVKQHKKRTHTARVTEESLKIHDWPAVQATKDPEVRELATQRLRAQEAVHRSQLPWTTECHDATFPTLAAMARCATDAHQTQEKLPQLMNLFIEEFKEALEEGNTLCDWSFDWVDWTHNEPRVKDAFLEWLKEEGFVTTSDPESSHSYYVSWAHQKGHDFKFHEVYAKCIREKLEDDPLYQEIKKRKTDDDDEEDSDEEERILKEQEQKLKDRDQKRAEEIAAAAQSDAVL